ncbi:MAG: hypothetical protein ACE5HE_01470 [Phycisphaerae bacterium]
MTRLNHQRHLLGRPRKPALTRLAPAVALLALALFVAGTSPRRPQTGRSRMAGSAEQSRLPPLVFTQIPLQAPAMDDRRAASATDAGVMPGSRIVRYDPSDRSAEFVDLTPGFAAAGSPVVSYDGRRILFVGRRKQSEPSSVWEMNGGGSGLRQVVSLPDDCDDAIYLSTIYTIDAKEPVHQIAFRCLEAQNALWSVYTCRLDGSHLRQITYSPYSVHDPYLLSDGRLLISLETAAGRMLTDRTKPGAAALYTVHVDGTELFPFAGVHEPPAVRSMPCETPDGLIVYVESSAQSGDQGGSLVGVARTRSLHTRRLIADGAGGPYRSPSALPDGHLLVSHKPRGSASYDLFIVDPSSGEGIARVFETPQWDEVDAKGLAPHPEPAGRSSVVDDASGYGQLYCLNAYLSNTSAGRRIASGEIERIRVIRALTSAVTASDVESGSDGAQRAAPSLVLPETVIGEVPVEEDGSFYIELPARTPIRLETLNERGGVLQAMSSWMWLMPGERRGCIGCHEDRELTPPNRHVMAVRKLPVRVEEARHSGVTNQAGRQATEGYGE